jgi:4-hydroxy-4-methyl-2-oxoglutarate aldolase
VATEQELAGIRARLFGLIDEERIRVVDVRRPSAEQVAGFLGLTDLCSSISDALDDLGIRGAISASTLVPRLAGTRAVGPAITIRYRREQGNVGALVARGERAKLADRDLYNVGRAGDIAVFDCAGFEGASVMGGLSAAWASRLEIAACIIDGAVRDVESVRVAGVPVWSRAITPVSGKHRLEAVEINGPVSVAGIPLEPGDLVAADETGVCVVPSTAVADVLAHCVKGEESERSLVEAIRSGASPEEVAKILRPERW